MLALICDDLTSDRELLEEFCSRYAEEKTIDIQTQLFENAGTLLQNRITSEADIIFMDIYMEGASGVDAARILRGKGYSGNLVFTTTSGDHYADGFDVEAVHYLIKPITWDAFCEAMRRCLARAKPAKKTIHVNVGRSDLDVCIDGIRYIEVYGHKSIINTVKGELNVSQSLGTLEQALKEKSFIKCYRCFIINMDYVQRIEGDCFLMKDNREIPISRDSRVQIKSRYLDYVFSKMED